LPTLIGTPTGICRNVEAAGVYFRCEFHGGYLDTLPAAEPLDAATALLVSQFLLDRAERVAFFRGIGERLRPGGWMIHSELAGDTSSAEYQWLLDIWWRLTRPAIAPADGLEKMRAAFEKDVAVLPSDEVAAIVMAGGFETPVQFLQTGLIHAWFARRVAHSAALEAR
jgi:tRNA (cmo5U34)-methyltransferase